MTIYDFSIATENFEGEYTKKEGDLINYLDHPSEWGGIPLRNCLITPIENIPNDILINLLCSKIEDGSFKILPKDSMGDIPWTPNMEILTGSIITEKGFNYIAQNNGITSNTRPDFNTIIDSETNDNNIIWKCNIEINYMYWRNNFNFYSNDLIIVNKWVYKANNDGLSGNNIPTFIQEKDAVIEDNEVSWVCIGNTEAKILSIRRFRISLEDIKNNFYPSLDLDRARDINDPYQPLIDNNIVLDYLGGISFIYDKFLNEYI